NREKAVRVAFLSPIILRTALNDFLLTIQLLPLFPRVSIDKITAYKKKREWDFLWISSFGTSFNIDFQATLDKDHTEYNFTPLSKRPEHMQSPGERSGISVFIRDGNCFLFTY